MSKMWLVPLGLLALLAACSSPTPAAPASASAPALAGTSWTVTQLNGSAALAGHEPTMEFGTSDVAGSASCNRYTGSFTQDGASVTVTPGVLTQMACADDVMTQEHAFTLALTQIAGARSAGSGVELVNASGTAVLTLAALEDKPLEGTGWTLSGIIADEAISSTTTEGSVTITISDGQLSGKACNTFRGSVTASGGSFKAGPLVSTKMACTSEALTKQENTVLATLQAATSYAIKGDQLTISADDGTGLVFTAAS
ncbi:MAG: META domain-containing protein [Propionicimonas sp.]|uniref:META domain-containing protein n=1 Tax=Propionicimonas sp. TaxID=1955623 RepID=UPI003D0B1993